VIPGGIGPIFGAGNDKRQPLPSFLPDFLEPLADSMIVAELSIPLKP